MSPARLEAAALQLVLDVPGRGAAAARAGLAAFEGVVGQQAGVFAQLVGGDRRDGGVERGACVARFGPSRADRKRQSGGDNRKAMDAL